MTAIIALLKNTLMVNCYLLTQAVLLMKQHQKMFTKNFLNSNICLTYPKDSKFFNQANKKVIVKMKDESERKIIVEFIGLKSKMYSMKNIDGKESNTAKGVNTATEFTEFKDTLLNKKVLRHKTRRIKGKKKIKSEHTKSTKCRYLFLLMKDLF